MKTTRTGLVPKRSVYNIKTENLQSSSDSDDNCELYEDCWSENTSPAKSDTSADSNPSSDDTFYSLSDIETTTGKSDHSISRRAKNTKCAKHLNFTALSRSGTGNKLMTATPEKETPIPSGKIEILNFPGSSKESRKVLNVRKKSTSKAAEILNYSGHDEHTPSDSSDSGWITVKSSARAKSQFRSKTLPASQISARQTEMASSSSKPRTDSDARMKTTVKTSSNRKLRGKATLPKYTMRNPNSNVSLRNQLYHRIPAEPSLPPSAVARANAPTAGACARISYSNVVGYSVSAEREITTDLNQTAGDFERSIADSYKDGDNAIKTPSLSISTESQTGDNAKSEENKLNPGSRKCLNCSNLVADNLYRFSPAVGTPVMTNEFCELHGKALNDPLPLLEDEDTLPDLLDSDFSSGSVLNLHIPRMNPLLGPVESRIWAPLGSESTNDNLSTNFLYAPRRSEASSDLRNLMGITSNATGSSEPQCLKASNVNMSSISEGASSSIKTLFTKSSNVSSTFRTEGFAFHPPIKVDKFYTSNTKNDTSIFLNMNERPINLSTKKELKKSLNKSAVCESSFSNNMVPFTQQANGMLESQNTIDNISDKSIKNANIESVLNKNKFFSSLQNKNTSMKSQRKNVSLKGRIEKDPPTKVTSKYLFQRTENSNKFTSTPVDCETMIADSNETSSVANAFQHCTDKEKAVHHTFNPSNSQSSHHSLLENPILKHAFPISHPVHVSNSTFSQISPEHKDLNSAISQTSTDHLVTHRSVPYYSTNHPVSNDAVHYTSADSHTSAEQLISNITDLNIATEFLIPNTVEPDTTSERLVSNTVPHTSVDHPVSSTAVPQNFTDQPVSTSAFPRPVSTSAFPRAFIEHPSSNNPFLQTTKSNFSEFRGQLQINSIQPPFLQQPGILYFLPPRNFHRMFAQPYNSTWAMYARWRNPFQSFSSSLAFVSPAFFYQSTYLPPGVFVPQKYPRHFTPTTNHLPVIQQTLHISPMQYPSTCRLDLPATNPSDLDTQQLLNPSFNPQAIICIVLIPHTQDKYPESIIFKQPSGHELTTLTCETNCERIYYSVSNRQFKDSDSDTDDSSFIELSQSELKLLNRKDFNRYFQRLERSRNGSVHPISSVDKTPEFIEKLDNPPSAKEFEYHAVFSGTPTSEPSLKKYPRKIILDQPSGKGLTTLTLATQSGQNHYTASNWQFSDSDSDSDDSSFTELSQSEIKLLDREDYNRYFRRLGSRNGSVVHPNYSVEETPIEQPQIWFFWSDEPDEPISVTEPKSPGVNLQGPSSKPMMKEWRNLKIPISKEENKDISGKEKQKRNRSISEKTNMNPVMKTQPLAEQLSSFRRSTSYPGPSNNRNKLSFIKD